jgi:hypothetical protein
MPPTADVPHMCVGVLWGSLLATFIGGLSVPVGLGVCWHNHVTCHNGTKRYPEGSAVMDDLLSWMKKFPKSD